MRVFKGFDNLPTFRRAVATIGSFDGVHCGHRVLLAQTKALAASRGGESIVLTFEPHPRITLGRADGLRLLNTLEEKLTLLEAAGIDNTIVIPFTDAFSRLSPEEFIGGYIVGRAGVEALVVGYNHRFGRNRDGDHASLSASGLEVCEVGQHLVGGGKVSSTVVRATIAAGDMESAARLLGEPYIFIGTAGEEGEVVSPESEYKLLPPAGRYAATVNGTDGEVRISDDGRLYADCTAEDGISIKILRKI